MASRTPLIPISHTGVTLAPADPKPRFSAGGLDNGGVQYSRNTRRGTVGLPRGALVSIARGCRIRYIMLNNAPHSGRSESTYHLATPFKARIPHQHLFEGAAMPAAGCSFEETAVSRCSLEAGGELDPTAPLFYPEIQDGAAMIEAKDKTFPFEGPEAIDPSFLETFDYEYPGRDVEMEIETEEFTAVCPFSGLPDFGILSISYVPDKKCIELRSLKYYLQTYRHVGIYQEHAVNRILDDLVKCCDPKRMHVILDYNIRGGIHTVATAEYTRDKKTDESN